MIFSLLPRFLKSNLIYVESVLHFNFANPHLLWLTLVADTQIEQDTLMARVYPKLRSLARAHGFEFQMVSMRW
jgi:hypothetical protein